MILRKWLSSERNILSFVVYIIEMLRLRVQHSLFPTPRPHFFAFSTPNPFTPLSQSVPAVTIALEKGTLPFDRLKWVDHDSFEPFKWKSSISPPLHVFRVIVKLFMTASSDVYWNSIEREIVFENFAQFRGLSRLFIKRNGKLDTWFKASEFSLPSPSLYCPILYYTPYPYCERDLWMVPEETQSFNWKQRFVTVCLSARYDVSWVFLSLNWKVVVFFEFFSYKNPYWRGSWAQKSSVHSVPNGWPSRWVNVGKLH